MLTINCPSCGAPVQFRSHAAVMAVCEFCRATVLKDPGAVKDLGKISEVLEDYTPIQIGTAGVLKGRSFTVVGRIQLRYSQGMWNEWYLMFDDASAGWLGDSSGMFTVTTERPTTTPMPAFGDIQPAHPYTIEGARFTASEKREAECIGGQGELPFVVGAGWQARVADFRSDEQFATIDYSDAGAPLLFIGEAVTLDDMKCQLLRDDEQIKASAGKYRGKLDALDCPSCGGAIKYMPGVTTALICPSCAAQLDAAGPEAQVLAAGERLTQVSLALPLGSSSKIDGIEHTVIGAMQRADDEGTTWIEYLLYSARANSFWLVHTDDGWSRAHVMKRWPVWQGPGNKDARLDKIEFSEKWAYDATVTFAAGAFNWRVAVGDVVKVVEFEAAPITLAAEMTADEMTWSRSSPVALDQLRAWFGTALFPKPKAAPRVSAPAAPPPNPATKFIWWIVGLNAIPLMMNFGGSFWIVLIAVLALLFPPKLFKKNDQDTR